MGYLIMNAAMVPNRGTFTYCNIGRADAVTWLKEYGPEAVSYVGYPQTAEHIRALSGVQVALNRAKCWMATGDQALVVKLAYRVADPATKGQTVPEDWEYGRLDCVQAVE